MFHPYFRVWAGLGIRFLRTGGGKGEAGSELKFYQRPIDSQTCVFLESVLAFALAHQSILGISWHVSVAVLAPFHSKPTWLRRSAPFDSLRFREKVEEQQAKAAKAIAKPDLEVKQKIPPCYEGKYQPGLHDVCGPPLRWFMPWATFGHLLATIVVPLLAVTWSQCEGEHEMLAKYPGWLWLPFFVWVAFMMLMAAWLHIDLSFRFTVINMISRF